MGSDLAWFFEVQEMSALASLVKTCFEDINRAPSTKPYDGKRWKLLGMDQ